MRLIISLLLLLLFVSLVTSSHDDDDDDDGHWPQNDEELIMDRGRSPAAMDGLEAQRTPMHFRWNSRIRSDDGQQQQQQQPLGALLWNLPWMTWTEMRRAALNLGLQQAVEEEDEEEEEDDSTMEHLRLGHMVPCDQEVLEKLQSEHDRNRCFKHVFIPQDVVEQTPYVGAYMIYHPYLQTPTFDLCRSFTDFIDFVDTAYGIRNCRDLLCPAGAGGQVYKTISLYKEGMFAYEAFKREYVSIYNACHYCGQAQMNLTVAEPSRFSDSFSEFNAVVRESEELEREGQEGECSAFHYTMEDWCGSSPSVSQFLNEYLFLRNQNLFERPYMCYCHKLGRWSFLCDAYAAFFIPFKYEYLNMISLVLIVAILLLILAVLVVPFHVHKVQIWWRQRGTVDWRASQLATTFFDLRTSACFFMAASIVLLIPEQFSSWPTMFTYIDNWMYFTRGVWLFASIMCMNISYTSMLIVWIHICSQKGGAPRKTLSAGLKLVTSILFGGTAIIAVALSITIICVNILTPRSLPAVWQVYQFIVPAYFTVIMIGFSIYGIRMYITLARIQKYSNKKVSFSKLKFTQFMMISNVLFLVGSLIILSLFITWSTGWDIFGLLHYLYAVNVLQVVMFAQFLLMTYLLFDRDALVSTYLFFLKQQTLKKLMRRDPNDADVADDEAEEDQMKDIDFGLKVPVPRQEQGDGLDVHEQQSQQPIQLNKLPKPAVDDYDDYDYSDEEQDGQDKANTGQGGNAGRTLEEKENMEFDASQLLDRLENEFKQAQREAQEIHSNE